MTQEYSTSTALSGSRGTSRFKKGLKVSLKGKLGFGSTSLPGKFRTMTEVLRETCDKLFSLP